MTAQPPPAISRLFAGIRRAARRRVLLIALLQAAPLAIGAAALAAVLAGSVAGIPALASILVAGIVAGVMKARRYDDAWLMRQLDRACPALEDSSALALQPAPATRLQALQQARVLGRIEHELRRSGTFDFRPAFPRRSLQLCLLAGLILLIAAAAVPAIRAWAADHAGRAAAADAPVPAGVVEVSLGIEPPAYTGLPARNVTMLDAKAPIDSKLAWSLRFARDPAAAALVFHDGSRLPLTHEGNRWSATKLLTASTLYRVETDREPPPPGERLSRLDALPDQPPEIIVRSPQQTLTVLTEARKSWDFAFEVRDDYGLGAAELSISLAQGSGEQIKVTETKMALDGGSDRHQRSYRRTLDLAALGFARGDDLIVRLNVLDNHEPQANRSSSASFILRWPPDRTTEGAGIDGLVQKTLPAYFRSERQIIIDTEALVARRGGIAAEQFGKQSDELGVDQKVLRLRYGQFLGEGFESNAEHALVDAAQLRQEAEGANRKGDKTDDAAPSTALKDIPAEKEAQAKARSGLGQEEDFLHEYGHAHDNAEATTLLDPETRRILKAALDEMWQAELKLRTAEPEAALPFEYKALDYIKQVQQSERIYLERAGLELPQADASRRLSGERAGLSDRRQKAPDAATDDTPAVSIWQAIEQGRKPDVGALTAWLREHPDASGDALGLVAAADRVQREPDCEACRADLKSKLWPLLPANATGVRSRRLPDAAGTAYLDALKAPSP